MQNCSASYFPVIFYPFEAFGRSGNVSRAIHRLLDPRIARPMSAYAYVLCKRRNEGSEFVVRNGENSGHRFSRRLTLTSRLVNDTVEITRNDKRRIKENYACDSGT